MFSSIYIFSFTCVGKIFLPKDEGRFEDREKTRNLRHVKKWFGQDLTSCGGSLVYVHGILLTTFHSKKWSNRQAPFLFRFLTGLNMAESACFQWKEINVENNYLYTSGGKFYSDGGFGFQIEFVPCEPGEEVRFTHAGVSNQHHWKKRRPSIKTMLNTFSVLLNVFDIYHTIANKWSGYLVIPIWCL